MRFKNIFTWSMSALVLSVIVFSCTENEISPKIEKNQEITLLKEKMPDVHDLIDFDSFKEYSVTATDGSTLVSQGFEAKENGQVVGYYLEAEDRIFYTAITDEAFIRTDLITDVVNIVPTVFSAKNGRMVPNLERYAHESIVDLAALGYESSRHDCYDICLETQRVCGQACLDWQIEQYEAGVPAGSGDVTVLDATLACINACYRAALHCIDLCYQHGNG